MLGLENLSTPVRLAIVIGATFLVLCLISWVIARRQKRDSPDASVSIAVADKKKQNDEPIETPKAATPQENAKSELTPDFIPEFLDQYLGENLNVISRLSEIIAKTAPSKELKNYGHRILNATNNTSLLIQNARLNALSNSNDWEHAPSAINFSEFIRSQTRKWSTLISSRDVEFTSFIDEKIPHCLYLDAKLLKKITDTLLSNSQNLTPKGRVHLHITGENQSDFDWTIKLILADTGHGFDADFKHRINDPKSNIETNSLAQINLLAARKLSHFMNANLNLKSVPGRGSEVAITFSTRAAMVMSKTDQDRNFPKTGSLANKRVLIIEDDKSSQEVLSSFLQPEGCEIDCIDDGLYAIETLERTSYDLILMDVRMDGLDGIKTTRAIRNSKAAYKDTPIIAITADTTPETNAKCMMAGVDLFLTKPVGAKGLFDAIRFVMDLSVDVRAKVGNARN